MPARSAGILLFRGEGLHTEVLLVRPGGPFWRNKDVGAWQIPKGLVEPGESEECAARRETSEELGIDVAGELVSLGTIRQAGGKTVAAFATRLDFDPSKLVSNTVEIVWPPRSGRTIEIPEIEEARWLSLDAARALILPSQAPLLDRLIGAVDGRAP